MLSLSLLTNITADKHPDDKRPKDFLKTYQYAIPVFPFILGRMPELEIAAIIPAQSLDLHTRQQWLMCLI